MITALVALLSLLLGVATGTLVAVALIGSQLHDIKQLLAPCNRCSTRDSVRDMEITDGR